MEKRGKFDYVLLETRFVFLYSIFGNMIIPCLSHVSDSIILLSGLADPGPIASIFWMDDELGSDIYLDGIVTLVDAKYISEVNIWQLTLCSIRGID